MQKFHGDLLVGGGAIRHLDGVLGDDNASHRVGEFEVEATQQPLLELGRPYLLLLDDGDAVKVRVKEIDAQREVSRLVVQFESLD